MHDLARLIKGCQARVYAPAGTHSICREHFLSYLTWPALLMSASAAIADPRLRRAFGQRAHPSDPQRTARVRIKSSRLCALVSRHGSAISQRTVMNNVGSRRRKGLQMFMKYAEMTMEEREPFVTE